MQSQDRDYLVARLAELDQEIAEAESSITNITITPTFFFGVAKQIEKLDKQLRRIEAKLKKSH